MFSSCKSLYYLRHDISWLYRVASNMSEGLQDCSNLKLPWNIHFPDFYLKTINIKSVHQIWNLSEFWTVFKMNLRCQSNRWPVCRSYFSCPSCHTLVDISALLFHFNIKHTDVSEQDLTSDLEAIRVRVLRACEIITSWAKVFLHHRK